MSRSTAAEKSAYDKAARRLYERVLAHNGGVMNKLKIVAAFYQVALQVGSVFLVTFPPEVTTAMRWFEIFNLKLFDVVPLDCAVTLDFYGRLLVVTLVPIALSALIMLVHMRASRGGEVRRTAFSAFLGLTFMVFPSVSNTVIQTFRCRGFDDGTGDEYLLANLGFRCGTPAHNLARAYAGLMVALYPIGVPLLYFVLLWRNRAHVSDGERRGDDDSIRHLAMLCAPPRSAFRIVAPFLTRGCARAGGRRTIPSTGGSRCSSAVAS